MLVIEPFKPDFINWLENLRLPDYHLEKKGDQYDIKFKGLWPEVMFWEVPVLSIITELRSRAILKNMARFELQILYARAMTKLWAKIEKLKCFDDIRIADFGTRRRHSFLWQDWCIQAMTEGLGKRFIGTSNCLIAMNNAPDVPNNRWHAMTRLDENRAKTQLAQKAGVHVSSVSNMTIWGNHSATQYPDFYNAKIDGTVADKVISDEEWLKDTFIPVVQKRGAAIIEARGSSSAASAANAVVDNVKHLTEMTPQGDWHSVCVCSDGSYGIDEGLIASFPVRSDGSLWEIVQDVELNDFSKEKIKASVDELNEERIAVSDLL